MRLKKVITYQEQQKSDALDVVAEVLVDVDVVAGDFVVIEAGILENMQFR